MASTACASELFTGPNGNGCSDKSYVVFDTRSAAAPAPEPTTTLLLGSARWRSDPGGGCGINLTA